MKVIIAGSRTVDSIDPIREAVSAAGFRITEVVSGKQKGWDKERKIYLGADYYGEEWARIAGIPIKPFPADWNTHGKAAGPMRNRQMAEYADALIAIWDGKSRGTRNMIDKAVARNLKVYIHKWSPPLPKTETREGLTAPKGDVP